MRLQVHTLTSWLVKTSTSTAQATRVETSQSMLGAGIPLPEFSIKELGNLRIVREEKSLQTDTAVARPAAALL